MLFKSEVFVFQNLDHEYRKIWWTKQEYSFNGNISGEAEENVFFEHTAKW